MGTRGSGSRRVSSGTYCQASLPWGTFSSKCWIQTTGTDSSRALSTSPAILATTASRAYASATTPTCTSINNSAVLGRSDRVVIPREVIEASPESTYGKRNIMSTPPPTASRPAVRIGVLVPLTRPGWVEAGQHLLAGLELGVREVNEGGGIAGAPLELVVRDTAADPRAAVAAVDELAGQGVVALVGEYHSVVARAVAARAEAIGLPFLCSSAVLDALTDEPSEWVARLAPAQSHGWRIYAEFLLGAGHRRVAVAAEPSVYWASGTRILRNCLAPHGGSVVEFDMRALSPEALCEELVERRATALLLLVGYPEAGRLDRDVCSAGCAARGGVGRRSGRAARIRRVGWVVGG